MSVCWRSPGLPSGLPQDGYRCATENRIPLRKHPPTHPPLRLRKIPLPSPRSGSTPERSISETSRPIRSSKPASYCAIRATIRCRLLCQSRLFLHGIYAFQTGRATRGHAQHRFTAEHASQNRQTEIIHCRSRQYGRANVPVIAESRRHTAINPVTAARRPAAGLFRKAPFPAPCRGIVSGTFTGFALFGGGRLRRD